MDEGYASLAIVPLGDADDAPVLGCLHMASRRRDAFADHDELLRAAGRVAGRLLQNHKQQDSERAALETIKEALLPSTPPLVPGLELGVYATTADELMHVGGDFYEVWELETGSVALVAGDHSGKGLDAVGTAARLRMELTALAPSAEEPAEFMRLANRALSELLPAGTFVSAICCTLDASRTLRICLAGHPAPLRMRGDTIGEMESPSNLPLGVDTDHRFESTVCSLEKDDLLVLYTDGVSESRNNGHLFGVEGVTRVVAGQPSSTPATIAQAVVSAAAEYHDPDLPADDRLVLVARVAT
jgi:serine phosphatase RsbU (regulator of sigma subunit)